MVTFKVLKPRKRKTESEYFYLKIAWFNFERYTGFNYPV
jgi:hypothetical protein